MNALSFTTIAKHKPITHHSSNASSSFLIFFLAELFLTFIARNVKSDPSNKELLFLAIWDTSFWNLTATKLTKAIAFSIMSTETIAGLSYFLFVEKYKRTILSVTEEVRRF